MSIASKVKLPSIAELTNHSCHNRLPQPALNLLPLLLIFRNSKSVAGPLVIQAELLVAGPPLLEFPPRPSFHAVPGNMLPYYSYVPQPPANVYLHLHYHPVYYPPVNGENGGASPSGVVQAHSAPLDRSNFSHQPYSVAEVTHKPMNKCHRCGTTETPEWRRGPNGLRTLCNACGLFHAKLVRRKGAVLAAEEVLNNKVCKGKNGRRVLIKKQAMDELKKRLREAQVTEIPPIPFGAPHAGSRPMGPVAPPHSMVPGPEYLYPVHGDHLSGPGVPSWAPRVALPPPVVSTAYQTFAPLKN